MNKPLVKLIIHILVILLATGCVASPVSQYSYLSPQAAGLPLGEVLEVSIGSTLWVIRQAIQDAPNTQIFFDGTSRYIFARCLGEEGWIFVGFDSQKNAILKNYIEISGGHGNMVATKTFTDFRNFLTDNGWKVIVGSQVPARIRDAVLAGSAWVTQMSTQMTTFFILVMPMTPDQLFDVLYQTEAT